MKFLTITKTKPVKLAVDTALKAGTPISITGEVANDDTAIGLVANDTAAGAERIAIVTEGMVDVNEIAASYGEALTDDCMTALHGITFLHGGKAVVPAGGGGGGGEKFVITLTPTNFDLSGTTDCTIADIAEAIAEGEQIVAALEYSGSTFEIYPQYIVEGAYPYFAITDPINNALILAHPDDDYVYYTDVFPQDDDTFVVTFSNSTPPYPNCSEDDIAAAANAGKNVLFKWTTTYGNNTAFASISIQNGELTGAEASALIVGGYDVEVSKIKYADGSWNLREAAVSFRT